jgi:UDP-N-acetylmuramate--alanine ligase
MIFGKTKKIHFVGIGGIGMSGMAELLHSLEFIISGSDKMQSERTQHLSSIGIKIFQNHRQKNITNCDVLVYSSAISLDNSEITAALEKKIPVIRRAELLGELLKLKPISIAIGGTHGKTTTSSMLGSILISANLNPTLVIGGIVNDLASNSISGKGNIILVEADEFDRTFLSLQPTMALITNIDLEHLDCYENLDDLQNAFTQFANSVPFYGRTAVCLDDPNLQSILPHIKRSIITFGFSNHADIQALNISYESGSSEFDVTTDNEKLGRISINAPGAHNIKNALAAICLAVELEIPFTQIQRGLRNYSGVWRRFQIIKITDENIMIVDDYAHHPSEVAATLQAAQSGWDRRVVVIFQPHLYSRTRDFHQEFARAFQNADVFICTDIYGAREKPIDGVSAELITSTAKQYGHKRVHYIQDKNQVPEALNNIILPGDMVITMGAGDIWRQNEKIIEVLAL